MAVFQDILISQPYFNQLHGVIAFNALILVPGSIPFSVRQTIANDALVQGSTYCQSITVFRACNFFH